MKITLRGQEYELMLPPSFAVRYEIVGQAKNPVRAVCAALGVCLPRWPEGARRPTYDYDPMAYGGRVLDAMVGAGVPASEVVSAGNAAYRYLADSLPSEPEVRAAQDFSVPPEEGGR